jgi:hypothetical protein
VRDYNVVYPVPGRKIKLIFTGLLFSYELGCGQIYITVLQIP